MAGARGSMGGRCQRKELHDKWHAVWHKEATRCAELEGELRRLHDEWHAVWHKKATRCAELEGELRQLSHKNQRSGQHVLVPAPSVAVQRDGMPAGRLTHTASASLAVEAGNFEQNPGSAADAPNGTRVKRQKPPSREPNPKGSHAGRVSREGGSSGRGVWVSGKWRGD